MTEIARPVFLHGTQCYSSLPNLTMPVPSPHPVILTMERH